MKLLATTCRPPKQIPEKTDFVFTSKEKVETEERLPTATTVYPHLPKRKRQPTCVQEPPAWSFHQSRKMGRQI